jgi:hypothetical protein
VENSVASFEGAKMKGGEQRGRQPIPAWQRLSTYEFP